ncbi:MAG TPA: hypothetical protein VKV04_22640 [Verrucomicrobiae bacterium]|nr:hypothetical protein [Verrucomicrobiae bacterium]
MNPGTSKSLRSAFKRDHGFLMMDLIVGMAIFTVAIMPLTFSFIRERQMLRIEYSRAVAVEIVDGEMEILAGGEWRNFPDGPQIYTVHAQAAACLPPGHFQLTKTGKHLRLEWKSDKPRGIGTVIREITVK